MNFRGGTEARRQDARGGASVGSPQVDDVTGLGTGERVVSWIWDHRWLCLFVCLCATVVAGWQARSLRVNNAVDIWFVENDPSLTTYRDFQQRFGNDEVVVIAFQDPDGILDAEGLRLVHRSSQVLETVDGIARIESLATLPAFRIHEDWAKTGPVSVHGPLTDGWIRELRARIEADPSFAGQLLSADRTTAVVLAYMQVVDDIDSRRESIISNIKTALDGLDTPYHIIGIGVVYDALNRLSTVDSGVLIIGAYLVTAIVLWLVYGRLAPMLLSLLVVATASLWLMGAYAAAGRSINMVTMVMPTLVTVIGIANCIHILRHVARMPHAKSQKERVVKGIGFMFRPCLFTTLTTAMGFGALAASPMPVIRDFGMFSSAGLVSVFVLTLILCTCALAWTGAEPRATARLRLEMIGPGLASLGIRYRFEVLAAAALVLALAGASLSRLVVDTYSIEFLFADHPVRQDYKTIENQFDGYTPLEFTVQSERGVLREDVLASVADWQRAAERLADVGWSQSIIDRLSRLDGGPDDNDASRLLRFDDQQTGQGASAQCCTGAESPFNAWADPPHALRVTFATHMQSARGIARTIDRVLAEAQLPTNVTATPSGYLPLYVRMMDHIVSSQIRSFAIAVIIIFAAIAVLFRSIRIALLSVPANLLPVLVTLGVMGLLGIRLDVATVTIAAILIGIVVDDSVLFLYQFRHEQQRYPAADKAILATARSAGQSIIMTTLVLALGFLVYGLAGIKSIIWFGFLVSLAMVAALLADLIVMPALIMAFRRALTPSRQSPGSADKRASRLNGPPYPNLLEQDHEL